jgi:hypothetical protein
MDASYGRMGNDARCHSASQGIKQMFDRIGTFIFTCKDGRFIRVQFKLLLMGHLLFGSVEPGDCCAVMITIDPLITSPEPALTQFGVVLDCAHRFIQNRQVDAVNAFDLFFCCRCLYYLLRFETGPSVGPQDSKGLYNLNGFPWRDFQDWNLNAYYRRGEIL